MALSGPARFADLWAHQMQSAHQMQQGDIWCTDCCCCAETSGVTATATSTSTAGARTHVRPNIVSHASFDFGLNTVFDSRTAAMVPDDASE